MADKPTVNTFASNSRLSVTELNANFDTLATAIEASLGRGGTDESPNSMSGDLDLNLNRIQNLAAPAADNDAIRLVDLSDSDATGAASAQLRSELASTASGEGASLVGIEDAGGHFSETTVETALGLVGTFHKPTYTELRAITGQSDGDIVVLGGRSSVGDRGGGVFYFDSSDLSTKVTADTQSGIYVAPNSDPTGANGAWVRQYSGALESVWFGVLADGVTDDAGALQACINMAQDVGGEVILPTGDIRLISTINITRPISIIGVYPRVYEGAIGTRGGGSWLFFDHSGVGLNIDGAALMGTVFLDGFGTLRTQPTPAPSWTPTAFDFDIVFDNTDLFIGDLVLYNPTKGIQGNNGNAGRLRVNSLRGQPLQIGVQLTEQFDAPSFGHIHFWPFWRDDSNVHAYTLDNLDAFYFEKVDNPNFDTLFTIFARAGLRLAENATGTTNKFRIGNADFDRGNFGIWVDTTATTGVTGQIANLTVEGESGHVGSKAVFLEGNNAVIDISNFDVNLSDQNAVRLDGSNNLVRLGNTTITNYNQTASAFSAIEAATGNSVRIGPKPYISGDGGSGGPYGGAGTIYVNEWRPYTPTVTATSGSIDTLGTVSGRYFRTGDTLHWEVDIAITTNGTASGAIRTTLPDTANTNIHVGSGRETDVSGNSLVGVVNPGGNTADIVFYDNTYPGADGARLVVNGFYRIA